MINLEIAVGRARGFCCMENGLESFFLAEVLAMFTTPNFEQRFLGSRPDRGRCPVEHWGEIPTVFYNYESKFLG